MCVLKRVPTPPIISHWINCFFIVSSSLKRRFYAGLGDVGAWVFATYCSYWGRARFYDLVFSRNWLRTLAIRWLTKLDQLGNTWGVLKSDNPFSSHNFLSRTEHLLIFYNRRIRVVRGTHWTLHHFGCVAVRDSQSGYWLPSTNRLPDRGFCYTRIRDE